MADLNTYLATTTNQVTFLKIFLTNSTSYGYLIPLINSLNTNNISYNFIETNSLEIITFYTEVINDFPCIFSFQKSQYNSFDYWVPCKKISLNSPFANISSFVTLSLYNK